MQIYFSHKISKFDLHIQVSCLSLTLTCFRSDLLEKVSPSAVSLLFINRITEVPKSQLISVMYELTLSVCVMGPNRSVEPV